MAKFRLIKETKASGIVVYSVEQFGEIVKEWMYIPDTLTTNEDDARQRFKQVLEGHMKPKMEILATAEIE